MGSFPSAELNERGTGVGVETRPGGTKFEERNGTELPIWLAYLGSTLAVFQRPRLAPPGSRRYPQCAETFHVSVTIASPRRGGSRRRRRRMEGTSSAGRVMA